MNLAESFLTLEKLPFELPAPGRTLSIAVVIENLTNLRGNSKLLPVIIL